jgi:predicted HD phosphohydrolase
MAVLRCAEGEGMSADDAVRRWDDAAKDPAARPPALDHFANMLRALAQ